ncbi:MAG: ribonucleotide reductase N-terminal alpha domain-containing protein [Chloroflexota bacterium]
MDQRVNLATTMPAVAPRQEKRTRQPINLTPNARVVLEKRYLRRGVDNKPVETPEEMFDRVARVIAEPDARYGGDPIATREKFYDLLTTLRFFPNSPTFTGAGTPLGQLAACFVLPITDDMGRDARGIFSTLRAAALVQQTGGGNGFSFSRLRPRGDRVATSAGVASGPVGFLRVYDTAFGEVAQGGTRRGANMAVLRVDHPDIFEFVRCKTSEGAISNFNISVGVTDEFMRAVENDGDFELVNPRDGKVWHTVRARELFDEIVKHGHHNGEPGVLFLDAANRQNPVPHLYELEATNPCHRGTNLVHTDSGLVPIRDLVGRDFSIVTPTGEIARAIAFPTGVKPLFRVRLDNGATIDLTENHNLVLADGFKRMVRDLMSGDRIALATPAITSTTPVHEFADVGGASSQVTSQSMSGAKYGTHFSNSAAVVKVEDLGIVEPVYNLTVDHPSHQFAVNGMISANCGEQWLGPYENCCLGSINLAPHITPDHKMDWAKLRDAVELSVHFLDNVVDANKYVPAVPELAEAAHRARRIGLGIMGLGDAMYRLGVRYGSRAGEEFAGQVMEFVRFHALKTSIELAKTRGAFPAIKGSLYDPENLKWTPPKPIEPHTREWGRPRLDWGEIVAGIKKYGVRNAAQTTVAPTGTIATVAGVESYGCEPVFALAYTRHVNDNGKDLQLDYVSPAFERALVDAKVDEATRQKIFERVRVTGTCQDIDLVPEEIRDTFVVASDITPEQHVRMQAALQAFVDNSMSKTINFPATATPEDVEKAYFLAWKLGCKGITVYVAGSRDQVVLETRETSAKKSAPSETPSAKKPRPRAVHGSTYEIATPLGKAYVTVNRNGEDEPFEVFCNVGKAGSDTAAVSEAIGRLISLALRLPSQLTPTERLQEIVAQLGGIGGGRPMGFGARRVRSLPDGIAQALAEDLGQVRVEQKEADAKQIPLFKVGDLCPECGQASFVNEEGCRKCYACGYSEC